MPTGRKRFESAWKELLGEKQDKPRLYPAVLGAYVDGIRQVQNANRPDFVYCRLRGSTSEVVSAFNDAVGLHWDLPVLIYRDPLASDQWKVYGRDTKAYQDWEGASYIAPHGAAHSFTGGDKSGIDPVWVAKRQYLPMLPHPATSGSMSLYVEPDFWYFGGLYSWWPGSGIAIPGSSLPTGALNGRFVTVYLDGVTETLGLLNGPEFSAWYPPTDPGDYISIPSPTVGVPLAAVFVTTGTTQIGWGEIYDLRAPSQPLTNYGVVTGSLTFYDQGQLKGGYGRLDVMGPDLVLTTSGTFASLIQTRPADQIGVMGWDDGAPLGTGTIIDWGSNLSVTQSGTVLHVDAIGGAVSTGTIGVLKDGVFQGEFRKLDFRSNLTVTPSGDTAQIDAAAGGGGGGGGAGMMGWDEGEPLGTGVILNVTGDGATLSLSGTVLGLHVPGLQAPITGTTIYTRRLVYDVTLATSTGSIVISPIPQDGDHLYTVLQSRVTVDPEVNILLYLNGESGTAYYRRLYGYWGDPLNFTKGGDSTAIIGAIPDNTAAPNYGYFRAELPFYSTTGSYQNVYGFTFYKQSTTSTVREEEEATFLKLEAIRSMHFKPNSLQVFASGTRCQVFVEGEQALVGYRGEAGEPGTIGVTGWDEGVWLGTGTILNAVGDGITASLSGTVLELSVPGTQDIGARVWRSGTFSVPNGSDTTVTFDMERWDTDNIHSLATGTFGRLTCQTAGVYVICFNAKWTSNAVGNRSLSIRLNGTTGIGSMIVPNVGGNSGYMTVSTIYKLSVDDYVEARVYQNSGGTLTIASEPNLACEFSMQLLAPT